MWKREKEIFYISLSQSCKCSQTTIFTKTSYRFSDKLVVKQLNLWFVLMVIAYSILKKKKLTIYITIHFFVVSISLLTVTIQ